MDKTLLGKRIKEARIARDYTLDSLAAAIGLNKSTVSRYERGEIENPKLPVIEAIANELRVNPAWLIGKSSDMTFPQHGPNASPRLSNNVLRIAGRDGSYEERILTDEQLAALKAIIDQMPNASEDL